MKIYFSSSCYVDIMKVRIGQDTYLCVYFGGETLATGLQSKISYFPMTLKADKMSEVRLSECKLAMN